MADAARELLAGSLAGFAATAPMTAVMTALYPRLPPDEKRGPLPPREITMQAAAAAGVEDVLPEEGKTGLTAAAHFGYGAATGAVYGLLAPRLLVGPVAGGVAFGLAVWAGSYLGLLPALRVLPPATDEPAGKNAVMIAAHVVWGAALGVLTDLMAPDPGRPRRERTGVAGYV